MGDKAFFFEINLGDHRLVLFGEDERIEWSQRTVQEVELLVAGWNRRFEARHCAHQWGETIQMSPEVWGPNVFDRFCEHCSISEIEWEHQIVTEELGALDGI